MLEEVYFTPKQGSNRRFDPCFVLCGGYSPAVDIPGDGGKHDMTSIKSPGVLPLGFLCGYSASAAIR